MPTKATGRAKAKLARNLSRHSCISFVRVRERNCVAFSWSDNIASKPMSSIRSTISRGPISARSNSIFAVSVARETETLLMPGTEPSCDSTVFVQEEHVIP